MSEHYNVRGEKVALGPVHPELLPTFERWMNDFAVTSSLAVGNRPVTPEWEADWYARISRGVDDRTFVIHELSAKRPIGLCGLHGIDLINRTAEFGIIIGERDAWGRGYGTEATKLIVAYGFHALNLHSVFLRAYASNPGAVKAYERAGFKEFGRRREAAFRGGQPIDVIYMDCLSREQLAAKA